MFGTRARYSTPSTFFIARHSASVSAIGGTALGCTKAPTSITLMPEATTASSNCSFCSTVSSVFSFCNPSRKPTSQMVTRSGQDWNVVLISSPLRLQNGEYWIFSSSGS